MKKRHVLFVLIFSMLTLAISFAQQPAAQFTFRENVSVTMSDGVQLATDLYLPTVTEKVPAVLVRTPYDRSSFAWLGQPLAARGYAVVVQDTRGRGASEGKLEPFMHERADGLATLEWLLAQPWSNGRVGLWGTSYLGFAGLMIAAEHPPAVGAMVSVSSWGDVRQMLYPGGAFQLLVSVGWNLAPQMSGRTAPVDWPTVFRTTPVDSIPASQGLDTGSWNAVGAMLTNPDLLKTTSIGGSSIDIPILHITGWNDFLVNDALAVYEQARHSGSGAKRQKLIVGPWAHDQIWGASTRVADEDFGEAAQMGGRRVVEAVVRWFDYWLRGQETGIMREPLVRYFVMNANVWRTAESWPPPEAKPQEWFLDSGGDANSVSGDGRLVRDRPRKHHSDHFSFDPSDPVPTTGGANFHHFPDLLGPRDQRSVELRPDVLVYTSRPLESGLQIAGPIELELFASTEGEATDFTAKLVEVRTDGYARIIADGISRVTKAELLNPITISLGHTAIAIPKGNRLRLEVSSSNFPKFSRNPNTGESPQVAVRFQKVSQRVDHGPKRLSHLRLFVLP